MADSSPTFHLSLNASLHCSTSWYISTSASKKAETSWHALCDVLEWGNAYSPASILSKATHRSSGSDQTFWCPMTHERNLQTSSSIILEKQVPGFKQLSSCERRNSKRERQKLRLWPKLSPEPRGRNLRHHWRSAPWPRGLKPQSVCPAQHPG